MKLLPIAMSVCALLAASACARERPAARLPSPSGCGADLVARQLGAVANPEIRAYIAARVGERPIRFYTVGDPLTMDYSPARLNVEIGKDGLIKRIYCG
jgi:hypothetical protein